jgi:hypothetical protein
MFSHLPARDPPKYAPEEGVDDVTLKQVNSFFPPINHEWMGERKHGRDEHKVRPKPYTLNPKPETRT